MNSAPQACTLAFNGGGEAHLKAGGAPPFAPPAPAGLLPDISFFLTLFFFPRPYVKSNSLRRRSYGISAGSEATGEEGSARSSPRFI